MIDDAAVEKLSHPRSVVHGAPVVADGVRDGVRGEDAVADDGVAAERDAPASGCGTAAKPLDPLNSPTSPDTTCEAISAINRKTAAW